VRKALLTVLLFAGSALLNLGAETRAQGIEPGTVLYSADWSAGADRWPLVFGWKLFDGMLVNEGHQSSYDGWGSTWLEAPYNPADDGLANVAVEMELQIVRHEGCSSFGLVVRGAYQAGIHRCGRGTVIKSKDNRDIEERRVLPDSDSEWHVYRVEARGNTIRILLDGAMIARATDNRFLEPGPAGMWADKIQVSVRAFRVIAL
jgi:hypothetical protein